MNARAEPMGRVLVIAGSDSGGGAGIQADIKTITALGAYAATVVTALTAQDTLGVHAIHPVPADFVSAQFDRVIDDIGADCIKTGMLGPAPIIVAMAERIGRSARSVPLVVDPVMVAKGGHALMDRDAIEVLSRMVLPLATLLTPNLPEAAMLCGFAVEDENAMRRAGEHLLGLGAGAVLMKGGHLAGDHLVDLLLSADGSVLRLEGERIRTRHTHGTGCTLASAIAAGLSQGMELPDAVVRARRYLREAISRAPGFGRGHGPLRHALAVP